MPAGGARPGAGRPPGVPSKTLGGKEAAVAKTGVTPLSYMLEVMRNPEESASRRDEMAKAAAQYVHPRLSSVDYADVNAPIDIAAIDARIIELLGPRSPPRAEGPVGEAPGDITQH